MHIRPLLVSLMAVAHAANSQRQSTEAMFNQFMGGKGDLNELMGRFMGKDGELNLSKVASMMGVDPKMAKMLDNKDVKEMMKTGKVNPDAVVKMVSSTLGLNEQEMQVSMQKFKSCAAEGDLNCAMEVVGPLTGIEASELKQAAAPFQACLKSEDAMTCAMGVLMTMIPAELASDAKLQSLRSDLVKLPECGQNVECLSETAQEVFASLEQEVIALIKQLVKEHKVQLPAPSVIAQQLQAAKALVPQLQQHTAMIEKAMAMYKRIYQAVVPKKRTDSVEEMFERFAQMKIAEEKMAPIAEEDSEILVDA